MPDEKDSAPHPLAFLRDHDAFVRRFVYALVLAPPPSRRLMARNRRPRTKF